MSKPPLSGVERGAAVRALAPDRARRRGRPADRVFLADEVAYLCAVPLERVLRVLGREDWRLLFFPGARLREVRPVHAKELRPDWMIPEGDVRRLVGGSVSDPPALFSVRRFAGLMGWSVPVTYERVKAGIVRSRRVLGHVCIPVSEYWEVPELRAVMAAPGSSFFARKRAAGSEEGQG